MNMEAAGHSAFPSLPSSPQLLLHPGAPTGEKDEDEHCGPWDARGLGSEQQAQFSYGGKSPGKRNTVIPVPERWSLSKLITERQSLPKLAAPCRWSPCFHRPVHLQGKEDRRKAEPLQEQRATGRWAELPHASGTACLGLPGLPRSVMVPPLTGADSESFLVLTAKRKSIRHVGQIKLSRLSC